MAILSVKINPPDTTTVWGIHYRDYAIVAGVSPSLGKPDWGGILSEMIRPQYHR